MDQVNRSQVQSIHTGVLSILVNFEMGVLVKKENPPGTSFDPSGSQSGNQRGVNFIKTKEIVDEKENQDTQCRFSN